VRERLFGDSVAVGTVAVEGGKRPYQVEDFFCDGNLTPLRRLRDKYLEKRGVEISYGFMTSLLGMDCCFRTFGRCTPYPYKKYSFLALSIWG